MFWTGVKSTKTGDLHGFPERIDSSLMHKTCPVSITMRPYMVLTDLLGENMDLLSWIANILGKAKIDSVFMVSSLHMSKKIAGTTTIIPPKIFLLELP